MCAWYSSLRCSSGYLPCFALDETDYRPCRRAPDKVGGRETWPRVVQLYKVSEERVVGAFDNDAPTAVASGLDCRSGGCSAGSDPNFALKAGSSLHGSFRVRLSLVELSRV